MRLKGVWLAAFALAALCVVDAVHAIGRRYELPVTNYVQPRTAPVAAVGERVLTLPEDGNLYYATLITTSNWQQNQWEREVVGWFSTNRTLWDLAHGTRFHHYTHDDLIYRTRLSGLVPPHVLPAILIQSPSGEKSYLVANVTAPEVDSVMPASSTKLASLVSDAFSPQNVGGPFQRPPCPAPQPQPPNEVPPVNQPFVPFAPVAPVAPEPPVDEGPSEEELAAIKRAEEAEAAAKAQEEAAAQALAQAAADEELLTTATVGGGLFAIPIVILVGLRRRIFGTK